MSSTTNELSYSDSSSVCSLLIAVTMKKRRSKKPKIELPDSILSIIFSKLGLKDLVKTSTLSKQWRHELGLRTDLNFDLHNMFELDCNTIQELQKSLPLFKGFQSEFVTRLDQFMLHYQGAMIRSVRVNFPLDTKHSVVIDRVISKGIAKGAKRIELLFSNETIDPIRYLERKESYRFLSTLLSKTDSLTYLHLQNCHLVASTDFSGFKNLRTLVLQLVDVHQNLLHGLFSNCNHLVDFTLDQCDFKSDLKIISPTLFHLNIVNCGDQVGWARNIDVIASNPSSIEYSFNCDYPIHIMKIEADMLSKFSYRSGEITWCRGVELQRYYAFGFSGLKNVTTIVFDGIHDCLQRFVMPLLFSECLQLEDLTFQYCKQISDMNIISPKLRHLKIIDCEYNHLYAPPIDIDALSLSSFEYSGQTTKVISLKAPSLLKVFWNAANREKNPCPFGPTACLRHIESLSMIITTSQVAELTKVLVQFQNLRQLELFIEGAYGHNLNYSWILDIAMASKYLQKLSLTIKNLHLEKSHMGRFQRRRRNYAKFFHNDLKFVELHGCVCSKNVIELASHMLRKANSLKKITFSSRTKFYTGAGRWTNVSDDCCWFERNLIHKMLKDEVPNQCQLIIF